MDEPAEGGTARRRDARRNRDLLVAAAREVFAAYGLDAPLDEIARRAGVGNATLYRHFARRAALVDAVFHGTLDGTRLAGERARECADPWRGLTEYLETVFAGLAADRGTNDLMTTGAHASDELAALHAHNRDTVGLLLERAQRQGLVRSDVVVEDLLFHFAALGRAVPALASVSPDAWRRQLRLLLDGLRVPAPAAPLPAPPLTSGQLGAVLQDLGPHRAR